MLKQSQPQKKLFDSERLPFISDVFCWHSTLLYMNFIWLICPYFQENFVAMLAVRLAFLVHPLFHSIVQRFVHIFPLQSKSCLKSHQPRPSLLNTKCIYCMWRYQCYSNWGEGSPGRAGSEHDLCCENNTAAEEYDLWRETAVCKYSPFKIQLEVVRKSLRAPALNYDAKFTKRCTCSFPAH